MASPRNVSPAPRRRLVTSCLKERSIASSECVCASPTAPCAGASFGRPSLRIGPLFLSTKLEYRYTNFLPMQDRRQRACHGGRIAPKGGSDEESVCRRGGPGFRYGNGTGGREDRLGFVGQRTGLVSRRSRKE